MSITRLWELFTKTSVDSDSLNSLSSAQVIVTHCADLTTDGSAGQGNVLIAEHAARLRRRFNLPIIAQREVLVAKPDLETIAIVGQAADGGLRTSPANTYEVCKDQQRICAERGCNNVLVVTFPDHMWRACEVYKKLGLSPIPAPMLGSARIYYDVKATRWQLRSRLRYVYFWELPARILFAYRGWI